MECMCAQTRPGFILSSERVFWGKESEPMLTPRENPLYLKKFSSEEDRTHDAASSRTASPRHCQRANPAQPRNKLAKMSSLNLPCLCLIFPELYYDRGNHHEFTSLVKELARPGELTQSQSYPFEFQQVEKPYESYSGANVRLR